MRYLLFAAKLRINSIASLIASVLISSAGRKRIEFSPSEAQHTEIQKAVPKFFRVLHRKIEREKYSLAARAEISPEGIRIVDHAVDRENRHLLSRRSQPNVPADNAQIMVERTISVKFLPTSNSTAGKRNALSSTSFHTGPAITPHTCAFFRSHQIGQTLKCSQHQLRRRAHAALHFVENQQDIVFVGNISQLLQHSPRKLMSPPSPWIGSI